ncbi:hypothetical protein DICPUDRAFT_150971 [Dictyostelium purpureum]|uniref:Uncharacterized protein n=1 Tax=Dictyostelium purpureum TaxID=5786 RepID=F0ZHP5_DICPU|nr:uncharacterized protein DICPUDRAFT_150971 [Dictyostelium purpureum]EGC36549.1 hypothetical protein DICPUDRAFT_150971 [Dictyostelium purpureum]|eukprot:XP_003286921.1 hypothetical protein DICPUDRAFT_150971 [Dictyostelium purpureum]
MTQQRINVIISGSKIANDISLNGNTFIILNNKVYFGPACKRNNPVAGMVGDYQCNADDFKNQRWDLCSIAHGMTFNKNIRRDGKHVTVTYDSVQCGAMKIKGYPTSPLRHGKNLWTADATGVWEVVQNGKFTAIAWQCKNDKMFYSLTKEDLQKSSRVKDKGTGKYITEPINTKSNTFIQP